jgi:hypothetical protein
VLTILDSKRENAHALGRKGERKKKSEVVSSKRCEKEKREGMRTHCAWATSFLQDNELLCVVRIEMRRSDLGKGCLCKKKSAATLNMKHTKKRERREQQILTTHALGEERESDVFS